MLNNRTILGICISVAVLGTALWFGLDTEQYPDTRPHYQHSNFTVTHSDKTTLYFSAEIANTPEEQAYGLMFIHSLPKDAGMIFPYNPPREIAFWMKNTLIPLDMLFIRPDHTIGRIVANAIPLDITPIPSQEPVIAVIEINGGIAKKDRIEVGDKISSPIFP